MAHNCKLCILCLYLPAGQHSLSVHINTVCKFHYRRDLMISAIRCGKQYTYILVLVALIGQMSCNILAYWALAKNPIPCIPMCSRIFNTDVQYLHNMLDSMCNIFHLLNTDTFLYMLILKFFFFTIYCERR